MRPPRVEMLWWLVGFATHVYSISLLGVLQSYPELSVLESYLKNAPNLNNLLTNANNFTFLAPNNDAVGRFISQSPNGTLTEDVLEALVQYSLLKGGFPTLSFSDTPQFVASNLTNVTYANVTAGQTVELVSSASGEPQVVTGNKNVSAVSSGDIVCTGGIVHIIDEVLSIPITAVAEVPAARLDYFVQILNKGGFLNAANTYVNQITEIPDVTYFLPNSAQALSNGEQLRTRLSPEQLQELFEYHVVTGFVGFSPQLTNGLQLKTAQGKNLTITVQGGNTYVNAAKVTTTDYIVANGVVHVIDNLLDPNNTALPPPPPSPKPSSSSPAPTAVNSDVATSPTPTAATHSSSSSGLSTGAKAGIGVGAAVGGLLVLAALIWFCRSRKVERESPSWMDPGTTRFGGGGQPMQHGPGREMAPPPFQTTVTAGGMHSMQESKNPGDPLGMPYHAHAQPSIPPRSPNHKYVDAYRF